LDQIQEGDAFRSAAELTDQDKRMNEVVRLIYLPKILRSERLRSDLSRLEAEHGNNTLLETEPPNAASYITEAVTTRPHVLLAYTYVMYMALFNGGHWIRGKLLEAGNVYWSDHDATEITEPTHSRSDSLSYLSFWHFDSTQHGEDVRQDFRARLLRASTLLTDDENLDVIHEARKVYEMCRDFVLELDKDASIERRVLSASLSSSPPLSPTKTSPVIPAAAGPLVEKNAALPWVYEARVRPCLVGAIGVLGGNICAWLWRSNAALIQRNFSLLFGHDDAIY
jgi:heme oxygenase